MEMPVAQTRPVLVFDVLGTIVDQVGSLRRRLGEVAGLDEAAAADVAGRWLDHVGEQEQAVADGARPFVPSHELDHEAVSLLVAQGLLPRESADGLADASQWQRPWPDSVAGLDRLAGHVTLVALSNASRRDLTGFGARAGLRWHQVLSGAGRRHLQAGPRGLRARARVRAVGAGRAVHGRCPRVGPAGGGRGREAHRVRAARER